MTEKELISKILTTKSISKFKKEIHNEEDLRRGYDQACDEAAFFTWINTISDGISCYKLFKLFNEQLTSINDVEVARALGEQFFLIFHKHFIENQEMIKTNIELAESRRFKKYYKANKKEIKEIKRFITQLEGP